MDPLTISALASLGIGGLQAGLNSIATAPARKRNKKKIGELEDLQKGGGFGLTGTEERILEDRLMSPVQQAALDMRNRSEQLGAAGGGLSGAQASRLRTEQARTVGAGAQQAGLQVDAADEQKEREQQAELEGRLALKDAMRRDTFQGIISPLSQAAGPIGALAGLPPGAMNQGMFGARGSEKIDVSKLKPRDLNKIMALADQDPDAFQRVLAQYNAQFSDEAQAQSGIDQAKLAIQGGDMTVPNADPGQRALQRAGVQSTEELVRTLLAQGKTLDEIDQYLAANGLT